MFILNLYMTFHSNHLLIDNVGVHECTKDTIIILIDIVILYQLSLQ